MRNIKLVIEYDGTNYSGWQIQNSYKSKVISDKLNTIQETIERVLRRILQEKIKVIASGRTDSGVHAFNQVVNFKTHSSAALCNIQKALNALLPKDIAVKEISQTKDNFHSRFSAEYKVYQYLILNGKTRSVFLDKFSWHIPYKLNIRLMQEESSRLLGRHDFRAFCASGSNVKNTVRSIKNISIKNISHKPYILKDSKLIGVEIKADGFLYNMVRNIVGTLVEIGRTNSGSIKKILSSKDRRLAGPTAPARGLFLVRVKY